MDEIFICHVDDCNCVLPDFCISCRYLICGPVSKNYQFSKTAHIAVGRFVKFPHPSPAQHPASPGGPQ
ncbi:hypothetical protein CPI84_12170 [Erwinia pyrifoliae]|nr:hypothetical protein CPI84_12170 [Erwinia pyrifoliae]MCA8876546.1 hypothetical protein [Erwinia pyrifoliae]